MLVAKHKRVHTSGSLRIIGGAWRRRTVEFDANQDIRPTPDRVRETLFNWLGPDVLGARCLDLFAGSGALGFEAASRGASAVLMNDSSRAIVDRLRREVTRLGGLNVTVQRADAAQWLAHSGGDHGINDSDSSAGAPFDIAFIDPPYLSGLAWTCAHLLESHGRLAAGALIYVETSAKEDEPDLPPGWTVLRRKQAGRVRYYLASRQ
jgi:16S rRNA (guanine966-N2)-methyltransferase